MSLMSSRVLPGSCTVLALGLLLAACGRDDAGAGTPAPQSSPAAPAQTAATTQADPGQAGTSCPAEAGKAPSGEIVATRISAADGDPAAGLYEGPVWTAGALYFSDFKFSDGFPSRIRRLDANGRLETVIEGSGSNGLALAGDGSLVAATHDRKELSRYDLVDGSRMRIAGEYQGQPFNSPNDLVVGAAGTIWFTDPSFQRAAAPGGQDSTRIYRVATDGTVDVVDDSIANPNGIALSPDGLTLYAAGGGEDGVLRAYPLAAGKAGPGRDLTRTHIPDGLAIDCLGNIYLTEHERRQVRVLDPQGTQIATIRVDSNLTNATFGGPERRTLYLTGAGAVWSVDLGVAGLPY